jgi:hypothetical protein
MRSSDTDATALPKAYDNSAAYPSAGNQGDQGSCTAWAVAYALKSYQEHFGNSAYTDESKFSPAYIYNQINDGEDNGSCIYDAMTLLVSQGVCSLSDMPYSELDYLTQPSESQKLLALPYKCDSFYSLSGVNDIKQAIISYGGVVIGIPVYPSFGLISPNAPVYSDTSGIADGRHAICLVGYDDSKQAFKFLNSWGPDWGIGGFGYVSYEIACESGNFGYAMKPGLKIHSFNIQFNSCGGAGTMQAIESIVGQNITLPKNAFTYNGAAFKGWHAYSTAIGGWLYENGSSLQYFKTGSFPKGTNRALIADGAIIGALGIEENDSVILAAVWESENSYTIAFDNNGGEGHMSDASIQSGDNWHFPNCQFTKDGMVFLGWNAYSVKFDAWLYEYESKLQYFQRGREPNGAKLKILQEGAAASMLSPEPNDTITLFAAWETADSFSIVFRSNDGEGYMAPMQINSQGAFRIPECGFVKAGKTFAGWYVYFCDIDGYLVEYTHPNGMVEYWHTTDNKIPNHMELSYLKPGEIKAFPFTEPNGIVYFIAEWE